MTQIVFSDQTINAAEGVPPYTIVVKASNQTSSTPAPLPTTALIDIYRPIIDAAISGMGTSAAKYLDSNLVLALVWQESTFKTRSRNSLPARGLGQYIYGTQVRVGILDPYNYGDVLPAMTVNISQNLAHYAYVNDRDKNMSYAIMAHYAGLRDIPTFYKVSDPSIKGSNPLSYALAVASKYKSLGGVEIVVPGSA